MAKRITLIWALLVSCAALCPWAPVISAQDPIRVESNQVLVPAVVFDKGLFTQPESQIPFFGPSVQDPRPPDALAVRNLVAMVYNKDGTLAARFSDFACCDNDTAGKPAAKPRSSRGHFIQNTSQIPNRYESQFDLPPGEYQIRAILSDGEKFGRQQVPLNVENFDDKRLSTSAIVLSRRIRAVAPGSPASPERLSGGHAPLVSKGIEITPTADNRFKKNESLYAYFEVYEPRLVAKSAITVEAHLRILDAKSGAVKKNLQAVNTAPYIQEGSPIIPIGRGISLKNLSNGSYRLEVRASDSTGTSTAWRTANFTIE